MLDVDVLGLDVMDRKLLFAVIEKFSGGPVGWTTSRMRSARRPTRSRSARAYLIQQGYLQRTPRGRVATVSAYRHLGLAVPKSGGPERCSDNDRKRRREAVLRGRFASTISTRCRRRGFHANYLSFMECARTELLQSLGFDLGELARRDRVLFVVHSAQIAYHKPALLNELLTVTAQVKRVGRARLDSIRQSCAGRRLLASAELRPGVRQREELQARRGA